jgi:hypothetical protein
VLALLAIGVLTAMVMTGRLRENQQLVKASGQGVMAEAPAEIDRVELRAPAGHWLFVRGPSGWRATADGPVVPAALGLHIDDSLKFMHASPPVRVMGHVEWAPVGLREFGLDPPRYTATLYHGERRILRAEFGGPNPQEVLQYMKLDGRDEVYLMSRFVGQEWEQALHAASSR